MATSLYFHLFSTPDMERVFSAENSLLSMIAVEAALAEAQSDLGMIPAGVATAIRKVSALPIDKIALEAVDASNLAVPFVKHLTLAVSADAAKYVHYGATSQDILDNALFLQVREARDIIVKDLSALMNMTADLALAHKTTVMPARTLLQQAMPTTFGLKCAGLLDALMRHHARLNAMSFTLQNGGAAGTMAGYGAKALELNEVFAGKIGFSSALTPFHGHRDRVLDIATIFASLTITLGKWAGDIALMMQTEVGEVNEGAEAGRGGSSAMPHKRNPALSSSIIAGASQIAGLLGTITQAGLGEHERAAGAWQSEWLALPQLVKLTGMATARSLNLMQGLEVNVDKMRKNLDITLGLVYSEKIKTALLPSLGREAAHLAVEKASKEAITSGKHLRDILQNETLNHLFAPLPATGAAVDMVDNVIAKFYSLH
jgi:3-carboxy-cis,cis-muconate cycloisomerase